MNTQYHVHRRLGALLVAAAVVSFAAPAIAASADGFPWANWAASLVNVAIFLGILVYFAGPKVQQFFRDRTTTLTADINEAKKLRAEAQEKLAEYQARLDSLDSERQELLDDYHKQGEREKDRLVADAKRQVEKMRADAELMIQQEVRKAVASIERQAVDIAVGMSEKALRTKLDASTQNVLVSEYVDDLKSMQQ